MKAFDRNEPGFFHPTARPKPTVKPPAEREGKLAADLSEARRLLRDLMEATLYKAATAEEATANVKTWDDCVAFLARGGE